MVALLLSGYVVLLSSKFSAGAACSGVFRLNSVRADRTATAPHRLGLRVGDSRCLLLRGLHSRSTENDRQRGRGPRVPSAVGASDCGRGVVVAGDRSLASQPLGTRQRQLHYAGPTRLTAAAEVSRPSSRYRRAAQRPGGRVAVATAMASTVLVGGRQASGARLRAGTAVDGLLTGQAPPHDVTASEKRCTHSRACDIYP